MRVVALALVCLVLPQTVSAQCGSLTFKDFIELVRDYRSGKDTPVKTLAECPAALAPIQNGLIGNRQRVAVITAEQRTSQASQRRVEQIRLDPQLVPAAAMLLFDAGRESLRAGRGNVQSYLATAVDALRVPRDAKDTFAAEWYATVVRWLRARFLFEDAERLLASAREWLPDEPLVLYESGVTAELLATAYRRPVPLDKSASRMSTEMSMGSGFLSLGQLAVAGVPADDQNAKRSPQLLEQAAEWLEPLIQRQPLEDFPRLRLAHVRLLQGDTPTAARLGDAVAERTETPDVAYLANLLSGAALEQNGDLASASLRYRRAVERFPQGQSARIALSEVLQRQGRYDEARRVIEGLLGMAEDVREPWWGFMMDGEDQINGMLASLRERARQ